MFPFNKISKYNRYEGRGFVYEWKHFGTLLQNESNWCMRLSHFLCFLFEC